MSLYTELKDALPFDPAEREGLWGYRRADDSRVTRWSIALGAALTVFLATGGGLLPRSDWGAAFFFGLGTAVFGRGLALTWQCLSSGGWRAWRRRKANEVAVDSFSVVIGGGLTVILATGGGGVGPAFPAAEALFGGLLAGMLTRALLTFARWP